MKLCPSCQRLETQFLPKYRRVLGGSGVGEPRPVPFCHSRIREIHDRSSSCHFCRLLKTVLSEGITQGFEFFRQGCPVPANADITIDLSLSPGWPKDPMIQAGFEPGQASSILHLYAPPGQESILCLSLISSELIDDRESAESLGACQQSRGLAGPSR